jgi:hypothetical protein
MLNMTGPKGSFKYLSLSAAEKQAEMASEAAAK